jgi:hypothetical protein
MCPKSCKQTTETLLTIALAYQNTVDENLVIRRKEADRPDGRIACAKA